MHPFADFTKIKIKYFITSNTSIVVITRIHELKLEFVNRKS